MNWNLEDLDLPGAAAVVFIILIYYSIKNICAKLIRLFGKYVSMVQTLLSLKEKFYSIKGHFD